MRFGAGATLARQGETAPAIGEQAIDGRRQVFFCSAVCRDKYQAKTG